ncbi:unnamed protein product, partial [Linum tenue]
RDDEPPYHHSVPRWHELPHQLVQTGLEVCLCGSDHRLGHSPPVLQRLLGLIGAASFWPLTVYFPIEMYIARAKVLKLSFNWVCLQALSLACLLVSLIAAAG